MSAYVINSKGVCMTQEMRKDRETLNTMDELGYRELEAENKKLKDQVRAAEGETSIVKGIGINSAEMGDGQAKIKALEDKCREAGRAMIELNLKYETNIKELDRLSEENTNLKTMMKGKEGKDSTNDS